MKKLFLFFCAASCMAACNNATTSTTTTDSTKTTTTITDTTKLDYPYTIDHPAEYWVPGNPKNAYNVLMSLKAFENNKIDETVSYFGDSVELRFDGFRSTVTNDSLKHLFTKWRGEDTSVVIKMDDWESVIGNDKKEEWVTLWYKQIETDKKGKTDSAGIVDDLKIENGKIVVLDEKTQHYPKPAK